MHPLRPSSLPPIAAVVRAFPAGSGMRAWAAAWAAACVACGMLLVVATCVPVHGGAIEVDWLVRSDDGRAIDSCGCADPAIARVRFAVKAEGGGADWCAGRPGCEFPCDRQTGTTPFAVPAGRYTIQIVPLDAEGRDLGVPTAGRDRVTRVPAPILRDVVFGQPTQLQALLITASCSDQCSGAKRTSACE